MCMWRLGVLGTCLLVHRQETIADCRFVAKRGYVRISPSIARRSRDISTSDIL